MQEGGAGCGERCRIESAIRVNQMVTPWLRRQQGKISQKAVYDSPLLH